MSTTDDFEILSPTDIDASFPESSTDKDPTDAPSTSKIRKLCACGCGEEVSGNRALKRGHSMGEGLSPSVFGGNDILVFQAAGVALIGGISVGIENRWKIPKMEREETEAIGQPLGRIAARHVPKQVLKRLKPGDAADAIAIITVMSAYIIRVTTMPKEKTEAPTIATNGHVTDSGIPGFDQYAYRPPETIQPQNGFPN